MQVLSLADDVYFAVSEGQGIFLDLKRDDYSAVPIPSALERPRCELTDASVSQDLAPHIDELIGAGLVACQPARAGGLLAYQSILPPQSNLLRPDDQRAFGIGGEASVSVCAGPGDMFDLLLASMSAARLLKRQNIHAVITRVRARKARATKTHSLAEVRRQTALFRKLRPWYPRRYVCLFDALALLEFLAKREIFPTWVFGVQAQPFGAHCWVQLGDQLLNESTEYAAQFTPIMAV